mgnify:CR=1 FL=1
MIVRKAECCVFHQSVLYIKAMYNAFLFSLLPPIEALEAVIKKSILYTSMS